MLKEILKQKDSNEFDVANLWEDYGLSQNDNRFKDLAIAPCGLVTKETCQEFKKKVEKARESIIGENFQEIEDETLIEAISLLLMGLVGELFEFDDSSISFYMIKLPICLPNFTRNFIFGFLFNWIPVDHTLIKSLETFIKGGTQFYRIQQLINFFKVQNKGALVTNVIHYLKILLKY